MVFRLEAHFLGNLILLVTQRLIAKLLEVAASPAHQEAMTTLLFQEITPDVPASREDLVHQVQGTQQVDHAVDGDLVQVLPLLFCHLPDVVGRHRSLRLLYGLQHLLPGVGNFVATVAQRFYSVLSK